MKTFRSFSWLVLSVVIFTECSAESHINMDIVDVSSSFRLITSGRVYSVTASAPGDTQRFVTGLQYVNQGESFFPAGDIQLVQRVIEMEKIGLPTEESKRQSLASLILQLYLGLGKQMLLNQAFFRAHEDGESADEAAIQRLRAEFGGPVFTEDTPNAWRISAYTVRENLGAVLIFHYTIRGSRSPFTFSMLSCEQVECSPPISLVRPLPR